MELDRFLGLLGLTLRAGKLAVGETEVHEALKTRVRAVFVASDAGEHTARKVEPKLTPKAKLIVVPYTKEELGHALGRETCAICAVLDGSLTRSLVKRIPGYEPPNTTTEVS